MSAIACTHEKQTRTARGGLPAQWVIICRGEEIGLLERFRGKDSPWQAYKGIGMGTSYVGAFYGPTGRICGRNAVLRACGLIE